MYIQKRKVERLEMVYRNGCSACIYHILSVQRRAERQKVYINPIQNKASCHECPFRTKNRGLLFVSANVLVHFPTRTNRERQNRRRAFPAKQSLNKERYRMLSQGILSNECWAFTGVYRMVREHGFQLYPVYNVEKPDHSSRDQNEAVYWRYLRNPVLGVSESTYIQTKSDNTAS